MVRSNYLVLLWLLAGLCYAPTAFAELDLQELEFKTVDELRPLLNIGTADDRATAHLFLARLLLHTSYVDAQRHVAIAERLLTQPVGPMRAYLESVRCWAYVYDGDMAKASQSCEASIEQAEALQHHWVMSKAYAAQALLYYQQGQLEKAYVTQRKAIDVTVKFDQGYLLSMQYNNMGLIVRDQGLYQRAIDYFDNALELVNPDAPNYLFRLVSFNLGLSYADLGQHQMARDFYVGGLEWARRAQLPQRELTALVYIAQADVDLGEPQKAIDSLERAVVRPEFGVNRGYLSFVYGTLANAYRAAGDLPRSLRNYEQALALAATDPNTFEQRRTHIGYAKTLYANGQVDQARQQLQSIITQLRQENSKNLLMESLEFLADLEESSGNYAASLAAFKEAQGLSQDFSRRELEHQLAVLRTEFEVREKEAALAKAQREQIIRNGLFLFVFGLAVIGYLFFSRRSQMQRVRERSEQAELLELVVAERTRELEHQIKQSNEAEHARIALERRLGEAEKLRVLGQLTGGIAHDFNNLLMVVIGSAELLRDKLPDEPIYGDLVNHIVTAAGSGADITRALMAYARKQPLRLETIALNEFLTQRIPLIARTLGGMVTLKLDLQDTPPVDVVLDSAQLTTALLNLALNAKDAQDNHGEIRVTLNTRDERWAVISVEDAGVGMNAEQKLRAVEPFYTTKQDRHGSGLGLSMVYGFSKQLGGDLEIDSELGRGTTVRVVLPIASQAAVTGAEDVVRQVGVS